ncbi:MAG: hypothetical protein DID91_2727703236 [Candidatus Nitrotoga sp. MKT]|nr:MAG: hypothetical protein DID91_2727703236 [Candidatus Nitrotoga sp. MKT]
MIEENIEAHDIGLTLHFKTLQSLKVPFSDGSVQRGLSAANRVVGLTSLGGAADKRYSLGNNRGHTASFNSVVVASMANTRPYFPFLRTFTAAQLFFTMG